MMMYENEAVTLFKSSLYETISTVVQTEEMMLVVDPCWLPHEVEEIRQYVMERLAGRQLLLLFTHSDFDHIIGYDAFPGAQVMASGAFANKTDAEKQVIIEKMLDFDDSYYITRPYEVRYPSVDWKMAEEGASLTFGNTHLVCYQAPGHNIDGIFTVVEPLGLLLVGDYFSNIEFPYIYVSSHQYEQSILKLESILDQHDIRMLVTGHGNYTTDKGEMMKRHKDSLNYIHTMREAVSRGDQTAIDEIIAGCPFPRNLKRYHSDNQTLFEKEAQL